MECDEGDIQSDPRKDEDWKMQRRKSRESKNRADEKSPKLSKTNKRNSTEPLVPEEKENEVEQEENRFGFLDLDEEDCPLKKKMNKTVGAGTSGIEISNLNLNASKVMNYSQKN